MCQYTSLGILVLLQVLNSEATSTYTSRLMLAVFQNLLRGPNALILVLLFIVVFILLRRSSDKPKSD